MSEFYQKVLGFRVSDWVEDFFAFLRCGPDHHTVNFLTGKKTQMHHIAFEVKDFAQIQNACELLGQKSIPIIWGPLRHGPGHNVSTYHHNPDSHVVEFYIELDQMKDEELGYFEPRPWHHDAPQRPKVWRGKNSRSVWGPPPTEAYFSQHRLSSTRATRVRADRRDRKREKLEEPDMTAIRGYVPATDRPGLGVHSLDHFVLAVPDLAPAQRFYSDFGLDVQAAGDALGLKTAGHDQHWGVVVEGKRKKLHHLSFGCYSDDLPYLQERAEANGVALVDPPKGFESNGFWFQDPAGLLIEIKVAAKVSPAHKTPGTWSSSPEGVAGAPVRAKAPIVRPRRLSHVLVFTPDVDRSLAFYSNIVGLRLSDRSDRVAFMHAIHGSDHHILAFAQSSGPGLHHCSWDMSGIDDIGLGAMHMAGKGYSEGWGLGRHVLGSNYFHYVRDPWGSYAEYSCDIDYIPAEQNWQAGSHPPEDSFYLWGPEPPADFALNREL
jgi:catechol 2,3-dioxygenase